MKRQMTNVCFEIPGPAVPQGRPRVTRFGTFFPKKSKEYRKVVVDAATQAFHGVEPMDGALTVSIHIERQPPASWSKKKKAEAVRPGGNIYATSHSLGDCDNLAKAILDGCEGIAFNNDAQIVMLFVNKCYGERDFATVEIYKIGD